MHRTDATNQETKTKTLVIEKNWWGYTPSEDVPWKLHFHAMPSWLRGGCLFRCYRNPGGGSKALKLIPVPVIGEPGLLAGPDRQP